MGATGPGISPAGGMCCEGSSLGCRPSKHRTSWQVLWYLQDSVATSLSLGLGPRGHNQLQRLQKIPHCLQQVNKTHGVHPLCVVLLHKTPLPTDLYRILCRFLPQLLTLSPFLFFENQLLDFSQVPDDSESTVVVLLDLA